MDDTVVLDGLIGEVYEAAMQPEQWAGIIERVTRWIEGDTCHLAGWDPTSGSPQIRCMYGLQLEVGDEYSRHHAANDPRLGLAMSLGTGALIRCHEHFDRRFVSRSEFFQDYLLPIGVHHLLGSGNLSTSPDSIIVIGFQRYVGHGAFEDMQYQRISRLLPHMQRSLSFMLKTNGYREAARLGEAILDGFDQGMFALDEQGRIAFSNTKGRALLQRRSPVKSVSGRLRAIGVDEAKLASAIDRVRHSGVPQSMKLQAAGNAESRSHKHKPNGDYFVNVVRVGGNGGGSVHLGAGTKIVVFVQSPVECRVVSEAQLTTLFRLTPAEARLGHALAQGITLDRYATDAGGGNIDSSQSTARGAGKDRHGTIAGLAPLARAPRPKLVWFAINSMNYFCAFCPECVVARRRHSPAMTPPRALPQVKMHQKFLQRISGKPR